MKKKLVRMCTNILNLTTAAVIRVVNLPTYGEFFAPGACCCALREHFKGNLKKHFETSFFQALQEIGGNDISVRISPNFSRSLESRVFHKVCSILSGASQASSDRDPSIMNTNKILVGTISTMRSFLTGRVFSVRKKIMQIQKKERKAKKKMSLWKKCVLRQHKKHVQSLSSTDSMQMYSSRLPALDSHGGSLQAAAAPVEDVHASEQAVSSSAGASEKTSSTQVRVIQVPLYKDKAEKERAETLRRKVGKIKLKKKTETEKLQSPKTPSSDCSCRPLVKEETEKTVNDDPKEKSPCKTFLRPKRRDRAHMAPTDSMASLAFGDWSGKMTVEQNPAPSEENNGSTALVLEDYVKENTDRDQSDVDPPFTIEVIYDSQDKTIPECQTKDSDDNVTCASEDSDPTERPKKRGFLRRLFSKKTLRKLFCWP